MANRQAASAWALVAALVLGLLAACADESVKASGGRWGEGVYVPADWALARAVTGHRLHVVMKKIECTNCHSMTENAIGPVTPERCAACHEKEARIEHGAAEAQRHFGFGAKADCTTCHAFTFDGTGHDEALRKAEALRVPIDAGPGPLADGIETFKPSDCKRCHADQLGDTPAVQAHGTQACLTCHRPHDDPTPQSAPCQDCHEITTAHAAKGKSGVETCKTCHQHQHAPASAAVGTCATCHAAMEPKVAETALFPEGHTQCVGCHQPHDFAEKGAVACKTCHEELNVMGGSRVPAHNDCTNCHAPHDVKASPQAACAKCHTSVHSDHPQKAGSCTSCHDPHPHRVLAKVDAKACSSCHQFARTDHAAHGNVACTGCHKPHGFQLALENLATCASCHAERVKQVSTNAGHETCANCHRGLPHRPDSLASQACESCHTRQHAAVISGHARCNQCHEPHSGSQATACGSCHKEEQRSAPAGHQACASCHDAHAGATKKTCANCHAQEAKTPHGQIASSAGCLSCHRPHGPGGVERAPACTTCHKLGELPGLHAQTKHQTCTTCHSGHGELAGTARDTCLSCHTDRKDHFPNGQRCASCHLFEKTR